MNIKKWFIGSVVIILSHIAIRFAFISQGYDITDSITTAGLIGMSIGLSYTSVIACIILLIIGKLCKDENRFAIFTTLNIAYSFFVISGNYSLGDEAMSTITEEVLYCIVNIVIAYRIYKSTNQQNDIEQSVQKTVDQMKKEPKDDEKARNHKVDKRVTTEPAKFKTEHQIVIETQENEALSIMQEAQLPKEEPEMGQINNQEVIPINKDYKNHAIALFCLCCVLAFGLIYSTSMIDDKNDQIDELNNKLAAREKIVTKSMNVIHFFNEYCVIVYENDPGYYHKYRCSKDTSDGTFYMYNINAAVAYGLKPCSQCKDLEVSTIVARQSI